MTQKRFDDGNGGTALYDSKGAGVDQHFKDLLEASSLGTSAARQIRASTPTEVVDDVRRRYRVERGHEPAVSGRAVAHSRISGRAGEDTQAGAGRSDTAVVPALDAVGQLSLADHDLHRRCEWRMRRLLDEADHLMLTRVKHPDGGERTVTETRADEEQQRQQINRETDMGSRKHRRLPRWQGWIPKFVLAFDFALLLYFFAGITNVDWQSPGSMSLAFAITLAGMVTVLAYGFLSFTGRRMRSYKNHAGTVHLDELDGFTKAAFGTAIAVITVLAALMYLRIRGEVTDAQAEATALIIPLAVAVVSAVANYAVVLIHALDGSDEVARLDKLAAATRRLARTAQRKRRRAALRVQ